jgi:hypothetical protein
MSKLQQNSGGKVYFYILIDKEESSALIDKIIPCYKIRKGNKNSNIDRISPKTL